MTFLHVLAWLGVAILVLVVVLFIALCIYLGRAAVQERRLSRLEAEAAEAELLSDRPLFAPRVPWQFDDDALRDPTPHDPAS